MLTFSKEYWRIGIGGKLHSPERKEMFKRVKEAFPGWAKHNHYRTEQAAKMAVGKMQKKLPDIPFEVNPAIDIGF